MCSAALDTVGLDAVGVTEQRHELQCNGYLVESQLHALIVPGLLHLLGHRDLQLLLSGQPDPVAWQNVLEDCQQGQHGQPGDLHAIPTRLRPSRTLLTQSPFCDCFLVLKAAHKMMSICLVLMVKCSVDTSSCSHTMHSMEDAASRRLCEPQSKSVLTS